MADYRWYAYSGEETMELLLETETGSQTIATLNEGYPPKGNSEGLWTLDIDELQLGYEIPYDGTIFAENLEEAEAEAVSRIREGIRRNIEDMQNDLEALGEYN